MKINTKNQALQLGSSIGDMEAENYGKIYFLSCVSQIDQSFKLFAVASTLQSLTVYTNVGCCDVGLNIVIFLAFQTKREHNLAFRPSTSNLFI